MEGLAVHGDAVLLGEFDLPPGTWLPLHTHEHHQLAWASQGVVVVNIGEAHWVLPPSRALWLPAGTPHRTGSSGNAVLRGIYADPARCPVGWTRPRMVAVRPLLRELLEYLSAPEPSGPARERAETVVFDLLEPAPVVPISAPLPADARARRVAEILLADPADARGLPEFGREVGASGRTLARLFRTETRLTFGQWRTQARLRGSLGLLARGMPIAGVARRVGYRSASAFVAAFHRSVGVPPGEYFGTRHLPAGGDEASTSR